ncbi:MAG TPA: hypothetical protein VJT72_07615 [Pseudonocardiaceae bacterium]|nr:hypothetical protein [Pseudonocardiaceae bacterium]
MLVRAAEIRDSEQQQVFDALDEIHARLAPLESLGAVRKRLSEMPDRTEVSVLAERVDEALSKLETQDNAVTALSRAIESIADQIAGLHKRTDDLDQHLDRQDTGRDGLGDRVGETRESLSGALESVNQRLDTLSARLDSVEESVGGRISSVTERLGELDGALAHRPDTDSMTGLVRQANEESEVRYTAQLDEAMATFAEVIMGGTPAPLTPTPPPPPRPAQRRVRNGAVKTPRHKEDMDAEAVQTA